MFLRQVFDGDTWTYTYLIADAASGDALLIDPVRDRIERDLELLSQLGFSLRFALDTHVHADHVTGAGLLRERTGCKVVCGARGPESADLRLSDGATLSLGQLTIEVIATPGHTDDSVSFRLGNHVFTGDALLVRGNGRTDFQNGSAAELYDSITQRIFTLPDATTIWPAHDYKGHTVTTVGEEKRFNPRFAHKSKAEFVATMDALGLPAPKQLHQAVPANREVGLGVGPDESDGSFSEIDATDVDGFLRTPKLRVIDVREAHELHGELGAIERSESIPMGDVLGAATTWEHDQPLLLVCRSGRRSRQVCQQLAAQGFTAVTNLRGGMLDYRERARTSRV